MPKSDCRSDTWPRSRTQPFCSTASATTLIFLVTPCNVSSPSSKYCGKPLAARLLQELGRIDRARCRGEFQHVSTSAPSMLDVTFLCVSASVRARQPEYLSGVIGIGHERGKVGNDATGVLRRSKVDHAFLDAVPPRHVHAPCRS